MAYDKASFLAGLAVGRNLKSKPYMLGESTFSFTIDTRLYDATETNAVFRFGCEVGSTAANPRSVLVDWGDGTDAETYVSGSRNHTYATPGIYTIKVMGTMTRMGNNHFCYGGVYSRCLLSVNGPLPIRAGSGSSGSVSFADYFNGCTNLRYVPGRLFAGYAHTSWARCSLERLFYGCENLQHIPENLFDGLPAVTSITGIFYDCIALAELPHNLFSHERFNSVTEAGSAFYFCTSLKKVPSEFFKRFVNCWNFAGCFSQCKGLELVEESVFKGCSTAWNFAEVFYSCNNLRYIGAEPFSGCYSAWTFRKAFQKCKLLTELPDRMFYGLSQVTTFEDAFSECENLGDLPRGMFGGCSSVTTFKNCFYDSRVDSLPADMFSGCGSVTTMYGCFHDVTGITDIPGSLFDSMPLVDDFTYTFRYCSGIISAVPELWVTHASAAYHGSCFQGCSHAANYDLIPSDWK